MTAPCDLVDGLALAAVVLDDRGLAAAAPALAPALTDGARDRLARLEAGDDGAALRALARSLRPPPPEQCGLPRRARALLAPLAPRSSGKAWLTEAPLPRHGYEPDPGLRNGLRRIAGAPAAVQEAGR